MNRNAVRILSAVLLLLLLDFSFFPRDAVSGQKSFLWKVRSKTTTVYLLGSVHFLKKEAYPLERKIEDAFEKSDVLAVEADITDATKLDIGKLLGSAFYQGDETLEKHVSRETYELIKKELGASGLPFEFFERQRPWFLALTLTSVELLKLGFDPDYGIDRHFLTKAQGRKKITELESLDYQLDLLSGLSDADQEMFLLYTVKDLKNLGRQTDEILRSWRSGDTGGLEAAMTQGVTGDRRMSSFYDKLIYERNRNMTSKIEGYLGSKESVFVVVGAGHLVGSRGIVELLRAKGYAIEQL